MPGFDADKKWSVVAGFVAVAAGLLTLSCDRDPGAPAPDIYPPSFDVVFPTRDAYDRDGDGLVDFEIRWKDAEAKTDPASFKVRPLTGLNGPLDGAADVLPGWRITARDSGGITFHETLHNLLHDGRNLVELSIRDSAGNQRTDTLEINLPPAALIKSIPTGVPPEGTAHGKGLVVCPDDHRVYVTVGRYLAVADADSLRMVGTYTAASILELNVPYCSTGDPYLYSTGTGIVLFDRPALKWSYITEPRYGSRGMDRSNTNPDLFYVGESGAFVSVVDVRRGVRLGSIPIPRDSLVHDDRFFDLAVVPGDRKLYITQAFAGGLLAVDPGTGEVISSISFDPDVNIRGVSDAIELSQDGSKLYIAVLDAVVSGVIELDTNTDQPLRRWYTTEDLPQKLAISPSGKRIFVTTQDRYQNQPSDNVLLDVSEWRELVRFKRVRNPGVLRMDGGVAFHPNGKLIFVARNLDIDVYLNRE